MARLFSTWQRPTRIWETGSKESPKSYHLSKHLLGNVRNHQIAELGSPLAISLSLRHALKEFFSKESKMGKAHCAELNFLLQNTH